MQRNLEDLCLTGKSTIREAMALMNKNCRGIALIVNENNKLISTLTDGDARRAILSGVSIDIAIDSLLVSGTKILPPHPISALIGTPKNKLLSILQDAGIRHLPLVEKDNTLMDLVTIDDFTPENELPLQAVIMAGAGQALVPSDRKNT